MPVWFDIVQIFNAIRIAMAIPVAGDVAICTAPSLKNIHTYQQQQQQHETHQIHV